MKIFARPFRTLSLLLLGFLLLVIVGFAWIFSTQTGTRTLMTKILPMVGVKTEGVQGSLLDGLHVEHITVTTPAAKVDIQSIDLEVQWRRLWNATVLVRNFSVGDVHIDLLNAPVQPEQQQEAGIPALPVDIIVEKLALAKLTLNNADGKAIPVSVRRLNVQQLQWVANKAGLELKNVEIDHALATSSLKGQVKLEDLSQKSLPLTLNLQTQVSSQDLSSPVCISSAMKQALEQGEQDCHIDVNLMLDGSLQDLVLKITGEGKGFALNGTGQLNLFDLIPLVYFKADVGVDKGFSATIDAKTHTSADKEQQLEADILLKDIDLGSVVPQSSIGSTIHLDVGTAESSQWKAADIRFQLSDSSRWNGIPLKGNGDINVDLTDDVRVTSDIQVNQANNQLTAKGNWGKKGDVLTILAKAPQLAKLYPTIGEKLSLEAQLSGGLQEHQLAVKGDYAKGAGKALGEAPVDIDLLVQGSAKTVTPVLNWVGQVQKLQLNHAGYKLANQQAVAIDVSAAEPLQWSVGEATLVLTQPNGELTEFIHQGSNQQNGQVQSQGNIKNLPIQQSSFDIDWHVTNQPTWNVAVNMLRISDDTDKIQSNPLANIQKLTLTLTPVAEANNVYTLLAKGEGEQTQIDGDILLNLNNPFVVDKALLNLGLSDGTLLKADASIQNDVAYTKNSTQTSPNEQENSQEIKQLTQQNSSPAEESESVSTQSGSTVTLKKPHVSLNLVMKNLALDQWSLGALPPNKLNGEIHANAILDTNNLPRYAEIKAQFADGSTWNKQKLSGEVHWLLSSNINDEQESLLNAYHLEKINTNLSIGQNHIVTQGAFGRVGDKLTLDIVLPHLTELYPGLTGGTSVKGSLQDGVNQHKVDLALVYALKGALQPKNPDVITTHIVAEGGWGTQQANKVPSSLQTNEKVVMPDALEATTADQISAPEGSSASTSSSKDTTAEGWSGTIHTLSAGYQQYSIEQKQALSLKVIPNGEKGFPEWDVGTSTLQLNIPGKQTLMLQQLGSTGKRGAWTTKGNIRHFVINKKLLDEVYRLAGQTGEQAQDIVVRSKTPTASSDLVLDIDWDISFDRALKGQANIVRRSGDLALPLAKPLPMDIKNLALKLGFTPTQGTHSVLNAQLLLDTATKGNAKVEVQSDFNGLEPNLKGGTKLKAIGGIKDIAWASVFTNDLLSLGGAVNFDAQLSSTPSGQWHSSGFIKGENLRIVEVENGVRLLNGTLKASFNDMKARIETLHFPAVIRVVPKEWRTRQWIEENPPAQNGSLNITGDWDLEKARGSIKTVLDHYPIVQRADRFAMLSGEIRMDANMPKINLTGKVTADAGWASIDIKDTVPTVDGDVIVLKPGQTTIQPQGNASEDLNMNLTVDLGPRFYLVGMGLNSGLVGSITLVQEKGRLTAEGQFRTRGGAIEAYGQRLQIARGEIAFGGNITNPSLNIEALRRGLEVEAGLRVIGTAKRPKITLVSYPDVSDVEKLSWLIMGRGPDSSSADLALLLSVGGSLITDGDSEPFYRKVGLDEVGVKAGSVGESDNILPKRTVADSSAYRGYEEASQLLYATKKFGDDWRVSAEQALSGSGTVIRGSYKLMKHLTVDAKVGTVNGIELLYKRIFKN